MQPRNRSHQERSDGTARFLHELRALRDTAGLDHAELAARAHYPTDLLQAAEAGPSLPDLPVLSAYVRACGGTPTDWEDRWRSLTSATNASSGLPTRSAGTSTAAVAGARAGETVTPVTAADDHNRLRIMAALNKVAARDRVASLTADENGAGPAGNHQVRPVSAQPTAPEDDVSPAGTAQESDVSPASNVASIADARTARAAAQAAAAEAAEAAAAEAAVAEAADDEEIESAPDPAPFPDVSGIACAGEEAATATGGTTTANGTAATPNGTAATAAANAVDASGPPVMNGASTAATAVNGTAAANGTAAPAAAAVTPGRLDDSWPTSVVIKPDALPWTAPQPVQRAREMPDATKLALAIGSLIVIVTVLLVALV